MVTKKRIGVLAGGLSAEREVSLRSGKAVFNALKNKGYDVVLLDVKDNISEVLKSYNIEVAFLTLHGGWGENGGIQGLLEVMNIPYTGSKILASALAMDKEASKKMFLYHGLMVPEFCVLRKNIFYFDNFKEEEFFSILKTHISFSLPWVVKPATEGSSIGVTIVKEPSHIIDSLKTAYQYGDRVIVERYIKGKEIQIGILGDTILGGVEVRPSREFYSYEAKYTPGLTEYILPPAIDKTLYEKIKLVGLKAHQALGCAGASRIDLILDDRNEIYVLEVNTIPGMTETSLLPKIANLYGLDFASLVEEILKLAIA
ncbi:MAG: D-alanine--D-alanine ligase [Thermodesulfovibrionales bacterium]|nr:D-alanine--D-alanine ligase [Thermodesulfovibrionales bacterium]